MSENRIVAFAIAPGSVSERERLDSVLGRLIAEDPTLAVRTDVDTEQVIVAGTSERQLEGVVGRLTVEFNIDPSSALCA